jgi:hypothetical protein
MLPITLAPCAIYALSYHFPTTEIVAETLHTEPQQREREQSTNPSAVRANPLDDLPVVDRRRL